MKEGKEYIPYNKRFATQEAYDKNIRRIMAYNKENHKQINLRLNKLTEPDLIEWLNKKDNVQGYIKALIIDDMIKVSK